MDLLKVLASWELTTSYDELWSLDKRSVRKSCFDVKMMSDLEGAKVEFKFVAGN